MAATPQEQYLDWAEKAAMENLRGRLATGDTLTTQAHQLLTLLLAAMAGALAVGAKVFEAGSTAMHGGALAVAAWLAWVAVVLTIKAIKTRVTQALHNEPASLYRAELLDTYTLADLRAFELQNVQVRINLTVTRNADVAQWLDWCRFATAGTPVVFWLAMTAAR